MSAVKGAAAPSVGAPMATNEQLQAQLDALHEEMRELRAQLAGAGTRTESAAEPAGLMSRRHLLRAAPVVALGGAVAALVAAPATPAAAATGDPLLLGENNHAGATTELDSALTLDGPLTVNNGMWADAITLPGINLNSGGPAAVTIQQMAGGTSLDVAGGFGGEPRSGPAIVAHAAGNVAVTANAGDAAERFSPATNYGTGLQATADAGSAIVATTTAATATHDAVTIDYAG